METRPIPFRLNLRTWHFERAAVLWLAFVFAYRAGGDRPAGQPRAAARWAPAGRRGGARPRGARACPRWRPGRRPGRGPRPRGPRSRRGLLRALDRRPDRGARSRPRQARRRRGRSSSRGGVRQPARLRRRDRLRAKRPPTTRRGLMGWGDLGVPRRRVSAALATPLSVGQAARRGRALHDRGPATVDRHCDAPDPSARARGRPARRRALGPSVVRGPLRGRRVHPSSVLRPDLSRTVASRIDRGLSPDPDQPYHSRRAVDPRGLGSTPLPAVAF